MSFYSIDFESRSTCDIKKLGGWRYADDESTELILCAISYGDRVICKGEDAVSANRRPVTDNQCICGIV